MGGDGGQEGGGQAIGVRISAGHQGGPVPGALLAAGDAHAQKTDAGLLAAELAGLGLGIMRVSAVDYNISRLQIGEQAVQHIIHWFAGLDHDQDLTGFFQSGT